MEYTSAHGCHNGWRGHDDEHRPLPCLTCRPNLAKTAQVHDCGETKEPVRRHPVEDAWSQAVTDEFADDHTLDPEQAPTPLSLQHTALTVQASSTLWASIVETRSQSLIGRINASVGHDAITTITTIVPARP